MREESFSTTSSRRSISPKKWLRSSWNNYSQPWTTCIANRFLTETSSLKILCCTRKMIWHASRWLISVSQKISLSKPPCTPCLALPTILPQRFSSRNTTWKLTSGAWVWCSISCCQARFLSQVALSQRSFRMLSRGCSTLTMRHSRRSARGVKI